MVNLVRQNDILHLIDWYQTEYCEAETYFEEFRRDIESWTAVDAVPVVRCGECKHRDPEDKKCDSGDLERVGCIFPVDDDYFCKYGER